MVPIFLRAEAALPTPVLSFHSTSKGHPQHTLLLFAASPSLAAPMLTAAGNHLTQWHLPLIRPLVLTSVLVCQLLANYRSCQNNYWERKTNFPFNHFSPYSSSPLTPCLPALYFNSSGTFGKVLCGDLNSYSSPTTVPMGTPTSLGPQLTEGETQNKQGQRWVL